MYQGTRNMSRTLLDLLVAGELDEALRLLDPRVEETSVIDEKEIVDMYTGFEWNEELLTRVTSLRVSFKDEVSLIMGISSKLGFTDIMRVLVFRNGFEPEGRVLNFDLRYTLSALEAAIVHGRLESIDFLIQSGTCNKWGGESNTTLFEYAYLSRQLDSMKRIVFWSEKLFTGVCSGDACVRVHFRMLMGMERSDLRIFSESSDSQLEKNTEKEIRLYILEFLNNDMFNT